MRFRLSIPVLLLSAGALAAQSEPQLSVKQLVEDFDVLQRSHYEAHGGLDRFSTRAEIDKRFEAHRKKLNRPMSVSEFAGIVSEALADLRDGHARLDLDSTTMMRRENAKLFPFALVLEGDRLITQWNYSTDTLVRAGMEIIRINNRPTSQIVPSLLPKISPDGFIETGRRARLGRQFPWIYWLYVDKAETFAIEARDSSGRIIKVTVPGILDKDRQPGVNPVNARMTAGIAKLDAPPANISMTVLPGTQVARIKVRAFDGQRFGATLDSIFDEIRKAGIQRVVLDLRGNGGGVDEYGAVLVGHFMDKPFRYFDYIHLTTIAPGFASWPQRTFDRMKSGTVKDPKGGYLVNPDLHSGVAEQKPSANPFLGKLVVLTDGATFSTAADVAAQLRSSGRATFVGEETAGAYEGNTSGLNALIILPNSRLRTRIMMYGYWNAVVKAPLRGRGIIPDHELPTRVQDILAGTDRALERAVSILQ